MVLVALDRGKVGGKVGENRADQVEGVCTIQDGWKDYGGLRGVGGSRYDWSFG